jgi:Flavin containing amine oxidoreductase
MSRTPLFAAAKKALALSLRETGIVLPQKSALTRRRLLRLSAAAAGAAALWPALSWSARAQKEPPSVGIVGGGVAGLTAAYRLQKAGAKPVLFEASNRWGGRMLTIYDFYKGMFCELGGEFVDTDQEEIQSLSKELGLKMQLLDVAGGEDLYFFGGKWYTPKDMLDSKKRKGAFVPIAKQVAADANKLTDKNEDWTDYARELDKMSLKAISISSAAKPTTGRSICSMSPMSANTGLKPRISRASASWISSAPISRSHSPSSATAIKPFASKAGPRRSSRPWRLRLRTRPTCGLVIR